MLLTHIWGYSTYFSTTVSGVFHDRWDSQTVNLVGALHFTENFHSFTMVKASIAWWTYSIWGDNVSKLFVKYYSGWLGTRHSRVIHFLLSFSVNTSLVHGVMWAVPESLSVSSFFTRRAVQNLLVMCLLVRTILGSEVMMLPFVWAGSTLVRDRRSQLIAEDIVILVL